MKNYSYFHLPEGYELYQEVRLEKDRKALLFMMIGQILLVLVMVFLGVFYCSPQAIFSQEVHRVVFRFIAMLAGIFVYILAHEWVHGLFIRLFSGKQRIKAPDKVAKHFSGSYLIQVRTI